MILPVQSPSKAEPGWTFTAVRSQPSGVADVSRINRVQHDIPHRRPRRQPGRHTGGPPGGTPQQGSQYVGEGVLDLRGRHDHRRGRRYCRLGASSLSHLADFGRRSVGLGARRQCQPFERDETVARSRCGRGHHALLQTRARMEPLSNGGQSEWVKKMPLLLLEAVAADMPRLWLELRPTRAFAGQPRARSLSPSAYKRRRVLLPSATKPDCPFPARIDLVPKHERTASHRGAHRRSLHRNQFGCWQLGSRAKPWGPGGAFTADRARGWRFP